MKEIEALKFRIEKLEELNKLQNNVNHNMYEITKSLVEAIRELEDKINFINRKEDWR